MVILHRFSQFHLLVSKIYKVLFIIRRGRNRKRIESIFKRSREVFHFFSFESKKDGLFLLLFQWGLIKGVGMTTSLGFKRGRKKDTILVLTTNVTVFGLNLTQDSGNSILFFCLVDSFMEAIPT